MPFLAVGATSGYSSRIKNSGKYSETLENVDL
jgi:hypothetical protein